MGWSTTHGESHLSRSAGPGALWALCWCGESEVPVTVDDVQRCVTNSCGRLGCTPPDDFTGWSTP